MLKNNIFHILTRNSFKHGFYTIAGIERPLTAHCSVFYALRHKYSVACVVYEKETDRGTVYYARLAFPPKNLGNIQEEGDNNVA